MIYFFKTKFRYQKGVEFLTLGATLIILIIISMSKYKLPHYLNIIFPVLAILTAAQFYTCLNANRFKTLKIYLALQYFVMGVCLLLSAILTLWVFPIKSIWIALITVFFLLILIWVMVKDKEIGRKIIIISVLTSVLVNVLMNGNFYPQLVKYDAGTTLSMEVKQRKIPVQNIYKYQEYNHTFDFYTQHLTPTINLQQIKNQQQNIWIITNEEGYQEIKKLVTVSDVISKKEYGITRLNGKFLNPNRREQMLRNSYLIKINGR
jgi:4-amino-4-deoxy-L-arabinose transferase-like glycosyltransferase